MGHTQFEMPGRHQSADVQEVLETEDEAGDANV